MTQPAPPARTPQRRFPRPSPFVSLLLVLAVIILGLLVLLRMKPHPDTSDQPERVIAGTAEQRANADAKAWKDLDDRRPESSAEKR